jgi:ubiquinone/menaquinone biosynthesis C-methylase UbiE
MSDDSRAVAENFDHAARGFSTPESTLAAVKSAPEIPDYLQDTYWWAYLHPKSFYFFERKWVVNLILWGNMKRLTEMVLEELPVEPQSRILQIACVYGEFSSKVADHLGKTDSRLEIVDVAPIQLENVEKKLIGKQNIGLHHLDSTSMTFPDASFDQTVVFFLLHEQPEYARRETVEEAIRVTRPGGKVIFVDYHGPKRGNPMRYVMKPILSWLEPYAIDLWREELPAFFPESVKPEQIESEFYFGDLYQKIVVTL